MDGAQNDAKTLNLSGFAKLALDANTSPSRKNHVPDLRNLIKEYQANVNEALTKRKQQGRKFFSDGLIEQDQGFSQVFEAPLVGASYELEWNIKQAKQMCAGKTPTAMSVEDLYQDLSEETRNDIEAEIANGITSQYNDPIILVPINNVDYGDGTLIIDGNHRVVEAHLNGQNTILAYQLSEEESIECMFIDAQREIYAFVVSMIQITDFVCGLKQEYYLIRKNPWNRSQKHRLCVCGSEKTFENCCINKKYYIEERPKV